MTLVDVLIIVGLSAVFSMVLAGVQWYFSTECRYRRRLKRDAKLRETQMKSDSGDSPAACGL